MRKIVKDVIVFDYNKAKKGTRNFEEISVSTKIKNFSR